MFIDGYDDGQQVLSNELLWEVARSIALELPQSELYPFAQGWDAVRVGGKWFMISTVRNTRIINLKALPLDVLALCDTFASITPGYHMNKTHWVSIRPGEDISIGLVRKLVTDSYTLIVESLPRNKRPIDTH